MGVLNDFFLRREYDDQNHSSIFEPQLLLPPHIDVLEIETHNEVLEVS
jgi:hypothetical protein